MKNLVIVESPAKAKTIEKFLGNDFSVMSSYGHIRDLQKHGFSIDVKDGFNPIYEIPDDKKELVKRLKKAAKEADAVWLASDEDREGEAIAWHLAEVLNLDPATTKRIVFHEITKPAILKAIENPRTIDIDRVNAQQARRVLDRIVGFELSPVLWKKIKPALSAGRVQSVAVRLICEREKEIEAFKPDPFFRVTAVFSAENAPQLFKAELSHRIDSKDEAKRLLETCKSASFTVTDVSVKPTKRSPFPPYTTSTLQQDASRKLGFSVNQTMSLAQRLYEDGKITYMRTDSTNLSDMAINDIKNVITESLGEKFVKVRHYHTHSKGAQEAHETIRPTYISNRTIDGTPQEQKLYELIWKRAVSSQMADAEIEKTSVDIAISDNNAMTVAEPINPENSFKAEGEVISFEGFLKVWKTENARDREFTELPKLSAGDSLNASEITATQRFTQAPARYSEASLVKKMEDLGIGRPSTYAPTISTIQARDYVKRGEKEGVRREYEVIRLANDKISEETLSENTGSEKGKLVPTDVGMIVNQFLTEYFPEILDYNFTAKVEEKFDDIAEGKLGWKNEISDFYNSFHPEIEEINSLRMERKVGERLLGNHPETGRPVSVKIGRFGPVVQIGNASDEEKPLFASLLADQSVATITLEEALKLFELPRTIGEFEGEPVVAAIGKFGPYVKHGKVFVSIPKDLTPQGITLEEAEQLILAKRQEEANRLIKDFPEMPGLEVLNGRYGPYLAYKPEGARKATNYRLPKNTDAAVLTLEEAKKIMESQSTTKKTTRKTAKKN
ncbi:type I DNA topoisomerase [Lepagella muris]|uniref:Type I DNA topoisomerase n=1 Tax=Lepagella muris TaxID=3032870 RepID=A0AC61REB7_9BACT|nr:type I DNA topoisomerase [Lepagella muris]TGY75952.1 type I DNA topoisomerase [Lepagella muris]THG46599.1 type I DNA topoisomerase [Bacteroidales bacterium]